MNSSTLLRLNGLSIYWYEIVIKIKSLEFVKITQREKTREEETKQNWKT